MSLSFRSTAGSLSYTKVNVPEESLLSRHRYKLLLALILLVATFFRFFGTNFDQNHHQHPDERFIVGRTIALQWPTDLSQLLDVRNSPMNLRAAGLQGGYPYGSLPVYLTRATGWLLDTVLPPTDTRPKGYFLSYDGTTLLGRSLAALFDLITIILVFLIGRRLYSRSAGLVAAALVAFAVTHIQLAHFYASDTFLTTFMMGAIYFSVVLMQRPAWWAAVGVGTCVGLAIASKVTIVPFALIVVAAVALRTLYRTHTRKLGAELGDPIGVKPASSKERSQSALRHFVGGSRYLFIAGFFAVLAFAVTEPYVLWSFDFSLWPTGGLEAVRNSNPWWTRLMEESETQSGRSDGAPFTRQYVGTIPLVYHLQQLVFWGLSPIPGIVVLAGFGVGLFKALRGRPAEVLLLTGALPYFATILTLESKWMRYMLPLVPIFCLLGAAMLVRGVAWERARRARFALGSATQPLLVRAGHNAFALLTAVTIGAAFLWAVAFANIYTQDHSREQASQWIYNNLPMGSSHSGEAWDDSLPLGGPEGYGKVAPTGQPYFAPDVSFDLYPDRPPQEELNYIRDQMAQTDYIILASNRLYGSMPHLPWRYAVQNRYYELLFAEKLGFVRVHTSHVTPELFGIKIDDQSADESFTVYDHPRVDIFKKVSTLTNDQLATLFNTAVNRPPGEYSTARHSEVSDSKSLAYDQPLATLPDVGDYSWNPLAQEDTQWIGVLLWLLAVYLLGILTLPIIFVAARNLPDRAYPVSKVLGLLLVSWATWMVANARFMPFTVWTVGFMVLLLAAVGALCWRLGAGTQIREFIRIKRGLVIYYEVVFLAAFLAFLVIRLLNPDLWQPWQGGEKPMELGFLNATLRSPWMPPVDPFYSGGYINYYYYGYFVVGCIVKLVGMDPHIAFNLAIPTLYAMAVSGATSVGYNIVAASRRERGSLHAVSRVGMVFGILSAVLMLVIGNMHALYQLIRIGAPQIADALVRGLAGLGISVPAFKEFAQFNFWEPRSIIPNTINEFPFWTYLFADLHPHLIDMPFTILALVLSVNLAFTVWKRVHNTDGDSAIRAPWKRAALTARRGLSDLWGDGWAGVTAFALFALVLGALAVTNSWDFPTFTAVAGLAVLIALLRLWRQRRDDIAEGVTVDKVAVPSIAQPITWPVYAICTASVGVLAAVSLFIYLPFFLSFKAFYTEIIPIVDGGLIPGTTQQMNRTALPDFILFWSFFIFIALSYLVYRLWRFPWQEVMSGWIRPLRSGTVETAQRTSSKPAFGTGSLLFLRQRPALASSSSVPASTIAYRADIHSSPDSSAERSVSNEEAHPNFRLEDEPELQFGSSVSAAVEEETPNPTTDTATEIANGHAKPLPGALSWADLTSLREYEHDPNAPLDGSYYATPDVPNWVAVAHAHAVPAAVQPTARIYSGVLPPVFGVVLLMATAGLVVLQIATGQYLLALLIALLGGIAATTLADTRSAPGLLTGGLLCVALAVAMGVELVYLADHLNGSDSFRMNTVFKFYIQVWVLFAAGSAPAVYYLLFGFHDRLKVVTTQQPEDKPVAVVEAHELSQTLPLAASFPEQMAENVSVLVPRDSAPPLHQSPHNWLVWSEASEPALVDDNPIAMDNGFTPAVSEPTTIDVARMPEPVAVKQETAPRLRPRFTISRVAWLTTFLLFLAASLLYPVYGTQARVNDRFPVHPAVGSLNGMNYMTVGTFTTDAAPLPINLKQDYAAINWMNKNISGLHTIAEVPLGYYREDGMRVASNTGFPMVVGGLHQGEQRAQVYDRLVSDRGGDMNEFFTTTDIQRALIIISKYDIEYIYIGQLERARAGNGIAKFEQMADQKVGVLKAVFQTAPDLGTPGTVVYQVVKPAKSIVGAPVPNSGNVGISITPVPTATSTPVPTPPVDDPELNKLIAAVAASPNDRETRMVLVRWYDEHQFFSDAARELETIIAQEPGNIAARHMLGDAYQAGGQPDKALRAWEQARDADPNNPAGHNKLGIALNERQRFDDAIAEFQAAVNVDPRFVEAWYQMGTAYEGKGDTGKAREAYQNAIDKNTGPNTWSDQARQRLGKLK